MTHRQCLLLTCIIAMAAGASCDRRRAAPVPATKPTNGVRRSDTTIETTTPLSVAEARLHFRFPFPDSATNVHFASYREWVAATDFVRFDAPAADCIAIAERLVKEYNAKNPTRTIEGVRPLEAIRHVADPAPLSVPWFTPQTIRKGLVAGERGSHQPLMWIDTERGVFYFQYTD